LVSCFNIQQRQAKPLSVFCRVKAM